MDTVIEPKPLPVSGGIVILRYWHIIALLVVQLLGLGIAYGKITQNQEDLSRRMQAIESRDSQYVPRSEFDGWREDIRATLNRIEAEIVERNREEEKLK